jgi:hypothetical protein
VSPDNDCARFYSRSHHAVIRVYDDVGNVIQTHERPATDQRQTLRRKTLCVAPEAATRAGGAIVLDQQVRFFPHLTSLNGSEQTFAPPGFFVLFRTRKLLFFVLFRTRKLLLRPRTRARA